MDPIKNPFSPGAGSPPPELVGRDPTLEQAKILLGRVRQKRPEKSMLLTGLRGVGKTVLLNEIEHLARKDGYRTIFVEAHENKALAPLIAPYLRTLLFDLDRGAGISNKVKRGLAVLRSFIGTLSLTAGDMTIELGIDPEKGSADSGDLEIDLPNLFVAIGEAAEDRQCAVAILIDEIQYFNQKELGALIMAMHKVQQRQLPIVVHTRNAMQETIETVKPFAEKGLTGIFHCFGESYEIAKQIIDMGFMLGIGGVVTYKKSGLDETLKHIDLKYLVLETDAPYLTPVPFRGKRNESSYLEYIVQKTADIENVPVQEVAAITTANAEKIFGG